MKCEFRILTGGRAGHREGFDKAYIALGRHPLSDLSFDADKDLDVSSRHAAVLLAGDRYVLRDVGSRNGTFVNGRRITADHELASGDRLRGRIRTVADDLIPILTRFHREVVLPDVPKPVLSIGIIKSLSKKLFFTAGIFKYLPQFISTLSNGTLL